MRYSPLIVMAALGFGALSAKPAEAACNVRGEFCGYPAWAANAFSHPRDRVPDWVLEDRAYWYTAPPPPPKYRSKRYRDRYLDR